MAPILISIFLYAHFKILKDKEFKFKYRALYTGLYTHRKVKLITLQLFFARRFSLALIYVFLSDYLSIQLILCLLINFAVILFIIIEKPYYKKTDYTIEIINEITILSSVVFIMPFGYLELEYEIK